MSRPMRSWLFVPGNRPERYAKALTSGADAVIIDLEDAVAPDQKPRARAALADWLAQNQPTAGAVPVWVRINASDTVWFDDDLSLAAQPGLAGVMLPKAEDPAQVATLCSAGAAEVLALIESAAGFEQLRSIARADGVTRLAFGSIDLQVDLGMRDADEDELLWFRSEIVLASRLAGIAAPLDGVSTTLDDETRLRTDVLRARRLGFGGKLCIHPRQVQPVQRHFAPSEAEIDWARRVIAADAASGGAAVSVDGKMVDKPVILRAQAIVGEAGAG
ncbi:HpcH/HpaI aldolase/citrate lyase family protein [Piscinibacter sakaiensis]|uniref:HpcH/HpaI aldolase/citrate lyase family protein n=1 Tax=Piscinibacter sakaiensis TaxID=1547922 RepID=UPI003AAF4C04